jgi:D-glycero-beta-D-manno-heptose-7-phosphate kinase
MIEKKRLTKIISHFKDLKILVIGDLMLDQYIWCSVDRISPEAPVPIASIRHETFVLGGAANVVNNLLALGVSVELVGLLGNDIASERIKQQLAEKKVQSHNILIDTERKTTTKTRIISDDHQLLRLDSEDDRDIHISFENELLKRTEQIMQAVDGIILSDYAKGLLTKSAITKIVRLAKKYNKKVFVDPTAKTFDRYRDVYLIKPNKKEAEVFLNEKIPDHQDKRIKISKRLKKKIRSDHIIMTLGKDGMILFTSEQGYWHLPAQTLEVYDVSGAGDTTMATIAASMLSGATLYEAGLLGNLSAGIVIAKIGTAVCTDEELLDKIKTIHYEK